MIDINPLEVLNKRKLEHIPLHFKNVNLGSSFFEQDDLEHWVRSKLKGRYSIKSLPTIDDKGILKLSSFLGLEEEKELTYFLLACPYFRR
jgi:hypothetical protein